MPNWLRSVGRALAKPCVRSIQVVQVWRERIRGRDELRQLDERTLQDVGLSRAQVLHEIDKWFWRA
jgi:uncharacterized protein YjiS (DUF1127 family)